MMPDLVKFMLGGIQFVLGDLEADTTPSAETITKRKNRNEEKENALFRDSIVSDFDVPYVFRAFFFSSRPGTLPAASR